MRLIQTSLQRCSCRWKINESFSKRLAASKYNNCILAKAVLQTAHSMLQYKLSAKLLFSEQWQAVNCQDYECMQCLLTYSTTPSWTIAVLACLSKDIFPKKGCSWSAEIAESKITGVVDPHQVILLPKSSLASCKSVDKVSPKRPSPSTMLAV